MIGCFKCELQDDIYGARSGPATGVTKPLSSLHVRSVSKQEHHALVVAKASPSVGPRALRKQSFVCCRGKPSDA